MNALDKCKYFRNVYLFFFIYFPVPSFLHPNYTFEIKKYKLKKINRSYFGEIIDGAGLSEPTTVQELGVRELWLRKGSIFQNFLYSDLNTKDMTVIGKWHPGVSITAKSPEAAVRKLSGLQFPFCCYCGKRRDQLPWRK